MWNILQDGKEVARASTLQPNTDKRFVPLVGHDTLYCAEYSRNQGYPKDSNDLNYLHVMYCFAAKCFEKRIWKFQRARMFDTFLSQTLNRNWGFQPFLVTNCQSPIYTVLCLPLHWQSKRIGLLYMQLSFLSQKVNIMIWQF
jgi:hypothetical protein